MYFPRLYELREDHDLTQKKIAEYRDHASGGLTAGTKPVSGRSRSGAVIRLAELYADVSTDYLLGLTDEKNGHA